MKYRFCKKWRKSFIMELGWFGKRAAVLVAVINAALLFSNSPKTVIE
jgi:hypothetical protein